MEEIEFSALAVKFGICQIFTEVASKTTRRNDLDRRGTHFRSLQNPPQKQHWTNPHTTARGDEVPWRHHARFLCPLPVIHKLQLRMNNADRIDK